MIGPGVRIGVFEITGHLGAGGMGEVYRARDTKLGRDVALKLLPAAFATDPDRLMRFEREARTLASLNHPHIAQVYGVEDGSNVDGTQTRALVMELVEGEDLSQRIARGPLPIDEALAIARQIADALEAAHEQGIIHRDLKPANIKVRDDGTVKVLDFGLAKALDSGPSPTSQAPSLLASSPTITSPAMTQAGIILGTAAYMSPEQAKGKPATKRSDIWAFGCVLYEMLTGRPVFRADDVAETLAAVLTREPDWAVLPAGAPIPLPALLRRCLHREPGQRWRDAADVRLYLEDAAAVASPVTASQSALAKWERWGWVALASLLGVAVAFALTRGPTFVPPATEHVELTTPPTSDPVSIAISPDGSQIVAVISQAGRSRLWLRSLRTGVERVLARSDGAQFPFWSPDGRSIGFHADGMLKTIDLDADSVRTLAPAPVPSGASWNREGTILYAPTALGPIWRVPSTGGATAALTVLRQHQPDENGHSFPAFLPDHRHFLFYVTGSAQTRGIYLGSVDQPTNIRRLTEADGAGIYSATGHLLYVRDRVLLAQPFDMTRFEMSGRPTQIATGIAVLGGAANAPALSASESGATLIYRLGDAARRRQFVWVDRQGKTVRAVGEPDSQFPANPSMSRDENRLLMSRLFEGNADLWLLDLDRGGLRRLTSNPWAETYPLWAPDGRRIAFSGSQAPAQPGIRLMTIDGAAHEEPLSINGVPTDWSPDSKYLMYRVMNGTQLDLWARPIPVGDSLPVANSAFNEREGQFSPDGGWVALQSDESGQYEIYLQSFPVPKGKVLVSRGGGTQPRWRADGTELYFLTPDNRMMAAPITLRAGSEPLIGSITTLFDRQDLAAQGGTFRQQYVVARDGSRFLINTLPDEPVSTPISVIRNWRPETGGSPR